MKIYCGGLVVSGHVEVADRFFTRLKGWLGKKSVTDNEALLIIPCSSIHTLGMRIKIDVLFLDDNNLIIHMIESMKPSRISSIIPHAKKVIELPCGKISRSKLQLNAQIVFAD